MQYVRNDVENSDMGMLETVEISEAGSSSSDMKALESILDELCDYTHD